MPPATAGGKRVDEGPNGKRGSWPMCRVFVRDSSFRLPAGPKTPILLIGPGTGIAPMRALLQVPMIPAMCSICATQHRRTCLPFAGTSLAEERGSGCRPCHPLLWVQEARDGLPLPGRGILSTSRTCLCIPHVALIVWHVSRSWKSSRPTVPSPPSTQHSAARVPRKFTYRLVSCSCWI